jgi:AraC family transcriptional regulator
MWLVTLAPNALPQKVFPTMPAARFRDSDVEVLTLPPVRVAVLEHYGDCTALEQAIEKLIAWRQAEGLHHRQHPTYNILYAPPELVPESALELAEQTGEDSESALESPTSDVSDVFRMDICVTIYGHMPENDLDLVSKVITGGRYAVVRITDSKTAIESALDFLRGDWLHRSGETLRDAPVILQRIGVGDSDANTANIVDLQLPLE